MKQQRGPKGITFEAVIDAAKALISEGERPTLRAVRDRLGSGSSTTIQKHLAAWSPHEIKSDPCTVSDDFLLALNIEISRHKKVMYAEVAGQIDDAKEARDLIRQEAETLQRELALSNTEGENSGMQVALLSARLEQLHEDSRLTEFRLTNDLADVRARLDECRDSERDAEAGRREAIAKAEAISLHLQDTLSRLVAFERRAIDAESSTHRLLEEFLANKNKTCA